MNKTPDLLALVYGVPGPEVSRPRSGVWLVHKHIPSGELLGPTVTRGIPTEIVHATLDRDGWREVIAA